MTTAEDVLSGVARWTCIVGDAIDGLRTLPDGCAQTCVTSPPYFGQRDYGTQPIVWPDVTYTPMAGLPPVTIPAMSCCLGNEPSPHAYVAHLVLVFRDVRRTLANDGTAWLNLANGHAFPGGWADGTEWQRDEDQPVKARVKIGFRGGDGIKQKDLVCVSWMAAMALQADGWWLRLDIIWSQPNPMPSSATDRPTRSHEYVFLLAKREHYFYDNDAIAETKMRVGTSWEERKASGEGTRRGFSQNGIGGLGSGNTRNPRSVWSFPHEYTDIPHYATMPTELARRCILAGSRNGDIVIDPFGGSGTTALVAVGNGRRSILCEINETYPEIQRRRLAPIDTDATTPLRSTSADFGPLFGGTR